MDEKSLHEKITALVEEEDRLRADPSETAASSADERTRLKEIETELDRLWDLLRQRRARREFGQDPDQAEERSAATVEGYRA